MRALVTGATRGIGRGVAERLAADGYEVTGLYVNSGYEAAELTRSGIKAVRCDVSDADAVRALHESEGAFDVVVNNAGVALRKLFQTVTPDEERRLYGVNLFGALNVIRAFLPDMINAKSGVIINVSSVFGETGGSMEADYSASKAALIGLTKALAKEVGPSQVRVNCVTPGAVDTDMNAGLSVDDVEALTDEIPLECLAKPADIASLVSFLVSEDASYITGAVIRCDGGWK